MGLRKKCDQRILRLGTNGCIAREQSTTLKRISSCTTPRTDHYSVPRVPPASCIFLIKYLEDQPRVMQKKIFLGGVGNSRASIYNFEDLEETAVA